MKKLHDLNWWLNYFNTKKKLSVSEEKLLRFFTPEDRCKKIMEDLSKCIRINHHKNNQYHKTRNAFKTVIIDYLISDKIFVDFCENKMQFSPTPEMVFYYRKFCKKQIKKYFLDNFYDNSFEDNNTMADKEFIFIGLEDRKINFSGQIEDDKKTDLELIFNRIKELDLNTENVFFEINKENIDKYLNIFSPFKNPIHTNNMNMINRILRPKNLLNYILSLLSNEEIKKLLLTQYRYIPPDQRSQISENPDAHLNHFSFWNNRPSKISDLVDSIEKLHEQLKSLGIDTEKIFKQKSENFSNNISKAKIGFSPTIEHRKNIGLTSIGRIQSKEAREKNASHQTKRYDEKLGKKQKFEHLCPICGEKFIREYRLDKLPAMNNLRCCGRICGRIMSGRISGKKSTGNAEQCRINGAARLGKKTCPRSDETRKKISEGNKGRESSTKNKIWLNKNGKNKMIRKEELQNYQSDEWVLGRCYHMTEETKRKLRDAAKKDWEKRKKK